MKIGVIYDADRMMEQAQNAFLKTLEEPPKNSHFILLTENPATLLPTVISRCQTISLISNKCNYDSELLTELFALLNELVVCKNKDILTAYNMAEKLYGLFISIYKNAERDITAQWKRKKLISADQPANIKKSLTRRMDAAVSAEYQKNRNIFLNAIYVWFAQLYQMTLGIQHGQLSNPEIILETIIDDGSVNKDYALRCLTSAERFIETMNWHVREELAVYELILKLVMKK